MVLTKTSKGKWTDCKIGITGANGSLGRALTKKLKSKGAFVIGITHSQITNNQSSPEAPQQWVKWASGKESSLKKVLKDLDILIINHGINPQAKQERKDLDRALEINALSSWRLIEQFESVAVNPSKISITREIWVNTSEAEIQPA